MSELRSTGPMWFDIVRWLSHRIIGINYRTKLVMSYAILWMGFFLILKEKSIGEFTMLAGLVLGSYATANVVEKANIRKMATIEKVETGDADVNVEQIPKRD